MSVASNVTSPPPRTAVIECATSNNLPFQNATGGDVLFYTSTSNQKILMSTLQSGVPALTIGSSNMIGVSCINPVATLHIGNNGNVICEGSVAIGSPMIDPENPEARVVVSSPGQGKPSILFTLNGEHVGNISSSIEGTLYTTTSDYRLKDVISERHHHSLEKIMSIPVHTFVFKGSKSPQVGCLAHEVQQVAPTAVTGTKDGKELQTLDYSKLVPLLIGAIHELKSELNASLGRE